MIKPHAVIIGVGDGLFAALARNLAEDYSLILAGPQCGQAETSG